MLKLSHSVFKLSHFIFKLPHSMLKLPHFILKPIDSAPKHTFKLLDFTLNPLKPRDIIRS